MLKQLTAPLPRRQAARSKQSSSPDSVLSVLARYLCKLSQNETRILGSSFVAAVWKCELLWFGFVLLMHGDREIPVQCLLQCNYAHAIFGDGNTLERQWKW